MGIEPFTGPLTAEKISDWLSRCEEDFDGYNEANPTQHLTNKQKIQRAVASISSTNAVSKPLSTWYTQNRRTLETKDWDTFRDLVKEHALGKGWRIKVLRDYYIYTQGLATLDDYFEKLEELKFTVARTSNLREIDPMVYKCHVLFGSRPGLVEKFMRAQKNDQQFINYDVDDIRTMLKDLDSEGSVPAQVGSTMQVLDSLQATAAAGLYITSGLFGTNTAPTGADAIFSCMVDVPNSSTALGHISSINCFYNDLSTKPQIQLLQVLYTGSWKSYPAAYHHVTKNISMNFAANEHLIQVTMTRDNSIFAISSINFKTSLSKEYFIGSAVGEKMTFTAPLKWRIVGFHGTAGSSVNDSSVSGSYRYPITKLGVVYAPIPV